MISHWRCCNFFSSVDGFKIQLRILILSNTFFITKFRKISTAGNAATSRRCTNRHKNLSPPLGVSGSGINWIEEEIVQQPIIVSHVIVCHITYTTKSKKGSLFRNHVPIRTFSNFRVPSSRFYWVPNSFGLGGYLTDEERGWAVRRPVCSWISHSSFITVGGPTLKQQTLDHSQTSSRAGDPQFGVKLI